MKSERKMVLIENYFSVLRWLFYTWFLLRNDFVLASYAQLIFKKWRSTTFITSRSSYMQLWSWFFRWILWSLISLYFHSMRSLSKKKVSATKFSRNWIIILVSLSLRSLLSQIHIFQIFITRSNTACISDTQIIILLKIYLIILWVTAEYLPYFDLP